MYFSQYIIHFSYFNVDSFLGLLFKPIHPFLRSFLLLFIAHFTSFLYFGLSLYYFDSLMILQYHFKLSFTSFWSLCVIFLSSEIQFIYFEACTCHCVFKYNFLLFPIILNSITLVHFSSIYIIFNLIF